MREPQNSADLISIYNDRAIYWSGKTRHQNEMINIYNNIPAPALLEHFKEEEAAYVANFVRSSWDDQAAMTGKTFPIIVPPWRDSNPVRDHAEKLEKIAYGWNDAGQFCDSISMNSMSKVWAWFLVGTGEAVGGVYPSYDRKTPYFVWRDPRTHLPPEGYNPWDQGRLTNTMFAYRIRLSALKQRYPHLSDKLDQVYGKTRFFGKGSIHYGFQTTGWNAGSTKGATDDRFVMVGEYYSEDRWIVATLEDEQVTLLESSLGDFGHPGIQPWEMFSLFNAVDPRSPFADQVYLQMAFARMLSLKIDYYEQTLDAPIFTTPLLGDELETGPGSLNYFDPNFPGQPKVEVLNPRNSIDADQTMSTVASLVKFMNRDSDARHGAGPADSAKAIDKLGEGLTTQIQDWYWPSFLEREPRLYSKCGRMCMNLWADETLSVRGVHRTHHFVETYKPSKDLEGHLDDWRIEQGLGLGGYSAKLEIMQLRSGKMLSLRRALELLPGVQNADEELRWIQRDQIEEVIFADLTAKAGQGMLAPGALHGLLEKISEGKVLADALKELEAEGGLVMPPPEEAGMPGMPGAEAGIEDIARMAAGMEGGGIPRGGGAPLQLIRGGRG